MKMIFALAFVSLFAMSNEQSVDNKPDVIKQRVVLGVVEFPPLVMKDTTTLKCHGDIIDAISALLTKLNYEVRVECAPPARLFERVRTGVVDLTINVKGTRALDDNVIFLDKPVVFLSTLLVSNKKRLNEKSVAAVRGYDFLGMRKELQEEGYTFFDMANASETIQLFEMHRTAHLLTYEAPYMFYVANNGSTVSELLVSQRRNIPSFLAVSKTSDQKDSLITNLEQAMMDISSYSILDFYKKNNFSIED